MKVLGIETSCDETAAAVVSETGDSNCPWRVCSNVVASQINLHREWGGVVPELASRQHLRDICGVVERSLDSGNVSWSELDGIAVTQGPGLVGSLLVGVAFAKAVSASLDVPLIPVHHLAGHIESLVVENGQVLTPAVVLVVSGGHTNLYLVNDKSDGRFDFRLIGRTRDDAAGEAFDKVARMLGLGFPGGPAIEMAASQTKTSPFELPRAWIKGTSDFSFSGLKSSVRRLLEDSLGPDEIENIVSDSVGDGFSENDPGFVSQVALAFEEAVVDVLVTKTVAAACSHQVDSIIVTGGVAANSRLRRKMRLSAPVSLHIPDPVYCTDNAAMIGMAGAWALARGDFGEKPLSIEPSLQLS